MQNRSIFEPGSMMTGRLCLNENFSTTRLIVKEKPTIENHPEDKLDSVLFLPENREREGEGGLRTQGYFKQSYTDKPLISIVTVVYNGEEHLEQTIKSVIEQSYDNVEYIIIDGGSTDGTLDIIKKYEGQIDYWVSEPDGGIYDAINKGVRLSTGDMVGIIHADDYYEKNILKTIAELYTDTQADVLYGDMALITRSTIINVPAHTIGLRYGLFPYSLKWIWVQMLFAHPSSFIAKRTYRIHGLYDTSFKIAADYGFFIRLFTYKAQFCYCNKRVSYFREGGISTTELKRLQQENMRARRKNSIFMAFVIEIFLLLKKVSKSLHVKTR